MRRGRWAVVRCARLRSALAVRPVGQGARRLHGWASGVRWLVGMIFDDGSTDRLLGRDVFLQMSALMIEAFFWQGLLLASGGGGEGAFLRDGARLTSRNALLARPIAWLALSWSTRFWVFVCEKGLAFRMFHVKHLFQYRTTLRYLFHVKHCKGVGAARNVPDVCPAFPGISRSPPSGSRLRPLSFSGSRFRSLPIPLFGFRFQSISGSRLPSRPPDPPTPRPPDPPQHPLLSAPSPGPRPRLSFSPAPQRRLRTLPQRLPSGGGGCRRRCARCV